MFYSLYQQYGPALKPEAPPDTPPDWPATYAEGFVDRDPASWTLAVTGLVQAPKTFTMAELLKLPHEHQNRRLISAEGWSYRSLWEGVHLRNLLNLVRPTPEAKFLKQTNPLGHTEYLPIDAALQNNTLLCTAEKSTPLSPLYGGPVRLLIFDRYSYKGMSQLSGLELVAEAGPGFWEQRGYQADGRFAPGKYYAFDRRNFHPVTEGVEMTQY